MPELNREPDYRDVETLMRSANYWPTDPTKVLFAREQAQTGAMAAVEEWRRATGWTPFLVSATAPFTTRDFDFGG
ncbi:MAG TPA: hypothetical protein VGB45_07720, partial [Abditibacterium sp.]